MNALNPPPTSAEADVYPFVPEGAEPARSRRWMKPLLISVGVLALGAAGWSMFGPKPAAPPAAAASQVPEVTVLIPGMTMVADAVTAPGSIAARRDQSVGVQGEGGRVVRVLVEPGQSVGQGQVLAVIDRSVQVQQAAQSAASIRQAEADLRLAQANLDRASQLVNKGFISRADIDTRTATRDSAQARVALARAQYAEQQQRIGRLDVRAPTGGLVLARNVEAGQVVSSGSGALFRIAEGGILEMRAQVAEQDMARLKPGMPAQVTPVGSTTSYPGKVWLLDPVIDPQSRQGVARVQLAYAPGLRVGAFARVKIAAGEAPRPLLPQSAVLADGQGNYVYILAAENRVARRPITIGSVSDDGVSITGGLDGTEKVVVSAGAFLKPGDKISPVVQKAR